MISGLQAKHLGFVEHLAWHLFEVGELLPLGLPTGPANQALLAQAIEVSTSRTRPRPGAAFCAGLFF
jgi:hypothetical protein